MCPSVRADFVRLRTLRAKPYSQKEAEAAVGLRTVNGTRGNGSSKTVDGDSVMAVDATDLASFTERNEKLI